VPLNLDWSALARGRLRDIHDYTAKEKPVAADRLATRIVAAVETLRDYPHLGRLGSDGTRELVIGRTPYVIIYRIQDGTVKVGTIWHGAQRRRRR
jgi:plasmid stabilization system protein ParE